MSAPTPSLLRRFAPLIVFVTLVVFLFIGLGLNPRLVPSPLVGKPAPAFSLPRLNAPGEIDEQTFNGHVTLFNVWASWCFACRQEHEVVKFLSRQGVRVIGLNYKDAPEDARNWLQTLGNPYQSIASDLDGRVGIDWGVYGAPETFLVDEQGIIRHKVIGPLSSLENIDELLAVTAARHYDRLDAALRQVRQRLGGEAR